MDRTSEDREESKCRRIKCRFCHWETIERSDDETDKVEEYLSDYGRFLEHVLVNHREEYEKIEEYCDKTIG